jgi:Trk K+ transport system NAD-binding subunit
MPADRAAGAEGAAAVMTARSAATTQPSSPYPGGSAATATPADGTDAATPELRAWSGHVIVCGLAGVGLRTVEQLHLAGVQVIVLDHRPDPRLATTVRAWGVPHLTGDAHEGAALLSAGLAGARAVVCTEGSDLRNVETALLVRDLRDDVPVVAHVDNPAVGRAVEEATGIGSVLDVAALFAPAAVEACLGRTTHDVLIGGQRFMAAEALATEAGTLRSLYGDLVPVAIDADDEPLVVCPGRDHPVGAGDRVTLLGTPSELAGIGGLHEGEPRGTQSRGVRRLGRSFSSMLSEQADRALLTVLGLTALLIAVSTVVLWLAYRTDGGGHLGLEQSLYFTVETVATVGFGDFSFAAQTAWLQAFGIALIVAGTTLVTTVFALITNLLVSRRIEQSLGHGKIRGMQDHVVLVGLGAVGLRVLEGLRAAGCAVIAVEYDGRNRYIAHARALGVPVVIGDATLGQTLSSVNIARARAVAILTSDDLVNLETGLAVRDHLGGRWVDVPVVLRVFDRALGRRLEKTFDFHHVWSTAALAAPWFVGAALGLEVLATFYVRNQPFLVARLTVSDDGGLVGLAMRELSARIRVVGIVGGATARLEHPPRRDTRFAAGDTAYLVGPYEELLSVLRRER